jgi:DNA-directed RNA polymerase subunit beta
LSQFSDIITRNSLNLFNLKLSKILKKNGLIRTGVFVEEDDLLLGKITLSNTVYSFEKVLKNLFDRRFFRDTSICFKNQNSAQILQTKISNDSIIIYTLEKRSIKTGDKLSGRHGNKGVISKVVPNESMPFTLDGIPLDIILNPLGIPSRMNIGQIMECLLGLAGKYLKENYLVKTFGEKNGVLSSKYMVFHKLIEAKIYCKKDWIFNTETPGKTLLVNGFNGRLFEEPIAVGYSYILKLVHMVDDKIHSRLLGPYSRLTGQPVKGKKSIGGQRFGEMEVWALEGFGAAYNLQELLVAKSDIKSNHIILLNSIILGDKFPFFGTSDIFKILVLELQCLCFDLIIDDNEISNFFWL